MKRELLRLENVCSGGGETRTVIDFSMVLRQGEIVGVLSDQQIVKRHIAGLIAGRYAPSSGRVYVCGEPRPFEEVDDHRLQEVGVVEKKSQLIDDFSVADNIFVMRRRLKRFVVQERLLKEQTRMLLEEYGLNVEPDVLARDLRPWQRCCIESIKALALGAKFVMFLDLSSFLSDSDMSHVLLWARKLLEGNVSFVLLESSPRTLTSFADQIILVRGGRAAWVLRRPDFHGDAAAALLEQPHRGARRGLNENRQRPIPSDSLTPRPALHFRQVVTASLPALAFSLQAGEELCLVDKQGVAIQEIERLLRGSVRARQGSITVAGLPFTAKNTKDALDQRVAFVVENPLESMLFPHLSALDNLCFPSSKKTPWFWLTKKFRNSCAEEYAPFFSPGALQKYPDELTARESLSLVYCRWHLFMPSVLVCIKPFNTADKRLEEVSDSFIRLLRAKGTAVLILASHAPDLKRDGPVLLLGDVN